MGAPKREESSFRDPSGYIHYNKSGEIFREVSSAYSQNYDRLMSSGLYAELIEKDLLIPHREIQPTTSGSYKTIQPIKVPFISYPYEWSFSQLKDAAITTLEIQKISMNYGMSLKDSSSYNIQFFNGKPTLIDTLSFEIRKPNAPWIAYRQFCQHFLAPLSLMSKVDMRLNLLMNDFIDGIPLDLTSKLLPHRSRLNWGILSNIFIHAVNQGKHSSTTKKVEIKMSDRLILALVDSLVATTKKLKLPSVTTEWGNYYSFTNYDDKSFKNKAVIIKKYISEIGRTKVAWDIGSNNGQFSRVIKSSSDYVISMDIDPIAVENNYDQVKANNERNLLPLVIDFTNPPPSIGWSNLERKSLINRGPAGLVLALAIVHHLRISNNVPLNDIFKLFAQITTRYLIIEFIPKEDSQVIKLLTNREDIFSDYTQDGFESALSSYFSTRSKNKIISSFRTLYLLEKK